MTTLRITLATIAWLAAITASAAAICLRPDVMGWAGIVGALAALGWGILKGMDDARRERGWEHGLTWGVPEVSRDGGRTWVADEDELPYRPRGGVA